MSEQALGLKEQCKRSVDSASYSTLLLGWPPEIKMDEAWIAISVQSKHYAWLSKIC